VKEYDLWHRLRHPNILPLEGICYPHPDSNIPAFVSCWQENGRIKDFVKERPYIDYIRLVRMVEGIAEGVRYLHENKIIHGDLRAANILISDTQEALVTDFGIAKVDSGDGVQISSAFQGNVRWM
ncbi:kinase-like protein, partial [Fomitiporia mediterranea MF3/22]|uniref:kinase-like protein n=1 Tax=Fomitiporia mediterranea (strain MF3/22) TaxID=694068 RepID=UPI000440776B